MWSLALPWSQTASQVRLTYLTWTWKNVKQRTLQLSHSDMELEINTVYRVQQGKASSEIWMQPYLKAHLSRACVHLCCFSCVQLLRSPWLQPARLLCPWWFSRLEYWSGLPWPLLGDLPKPGIKPRPPTLQANSLLTEPPGKPKNTGVGSISLLQGIFLTQESSWDLWHCRWILYQLSYQGSPWHAYQISI